MVGVWIALGHTTSENGAMYLLPGCHKSWGAHHHFLRRDWQICDSNIDAMRQQMVIAEMEPGDVLMSRL